MKDLFFLLSPGAFTTIEILVNTERANASAAQMPECMTRQIYASLFPFPFQKTIVLTSL